MKDWYRIVCKTEEQVGPSAEDKVVVRIGARRPGDQKVKMWSAKEVNDAIAQGNRFFTDVNGTYQFVEVAMTVPHDQFYPPIFYVRSAPGAPKDNNLDLVPPCD